MKKYEKKLLIGLFGLVGLFMLIGIAGEYDYCEQMILHMSCEQYDWVKDTLTKQMGKSPSDKEIAHWWAEHHGDF